MNKELFKTWGLRFLRGFVSGAVAQMVMVLPNEIRTFTQLSDWLGVLVIMGITGGITGALMMFDKMFRDCKSKSS